MQVIRSDDARKGPVTGSIVSATAAVDPGRLRSLVEAISFPRHYVLEPEANRRAGASVEDQLRSYGYRTERQGEFGNVVALPEGHIAEPLVLIGAHYDSVPRTPGADDNGSAVAAMLEAARVIAEAGAPRPVGFAAFNREEDTLLGSTEFVESYLPTCGFRVRETHVLEMVGYCSHEPGSQRLPPGLPIARPEAGDFLAVLANRDSPGILGSVMRSARTYVAGLPVMGVSIRFGLEAHFPDLTRSDHAPFWRARRPALMWTDTSEYRNPHYHQPSDTPDTLDYDFLARVTRLLVAHALTE